MTFIEQREMTAAQWSSLNPVLLKGEVGWVSGPVTKAKKGDGVTAWNSLGYWLDNSNVPAPLDSPNFTGDPRVPTAATSDNDTTIANTAFVKAAIAQLIAGAPGLLDTLDEIAAALGDDPNFAATITTALSQKAPLANPIFTGDARAVTPTAGDNDTSIATTAFVTTANVNQRTAVETLTNKTITDPTNTVAKATLSNPYKVSAYRAAAQNATAGAFALVALDTENFDTGNNFASSIFTAPVAGFYQVNFLVTSAASTTRWVAGLFKNGTTTEVCRGSEAAATTNPAASGGGRLLQLAANDTIRLMIFSSAAVALQPGDMYTFMTIALDSKS